MPLLYSAIVPHSPILLPSIGKEYTEQLKATISGLETINAHLRELEIDTIVLIASEGDSTPRGGEETFFIHAPEQYKADFIEFGDLRTKLEFNTDHFLADQIKRELLNAGLSVQYHSTEKLGYDSAVPLSYLVKGIEAKVVLIHPSGASAKQQFLFGKELQKSLQESPRHIALIASGELSHRLTPESPAGYWKDALSFDQQLIKMLKEKRYRKILNLKPEVLIEAQACGLSAFLVLLGAIEHINFTAHQISYEGPLGIGHLVTEYVL